MGERKSVVSLRQNRSWLAYEPRATFCVARAEVYLSMRVILNRARLGAVSAITLAAALVVLLGFRVNNLEERLEVQRQRASSPHPAYYVPTFQALTLDGDTVTIGEAKAGRQVLFVFRTTCPYCLASLPAWKEIAAVADTFNQFPIQIHAITLDSAEATQQYVRVNDLRMNVVAFPARKLSRLYRVRAVPQFYVLNHEGAVMYSRTGVLQDRMAIDSLISVLVTPEH